jgi:hypothetical protein
MVCLANVSIFQLLNKVIKNLFCVYMETKRDPKCGHISQKENSGIWRNGPKDMADHKESHLFLDVKFQNDNVYKYQSKTGVVAHFCNPSYLSPRELDNCS